MTATTTPLTEPVGSADPRHPSDEFLEQEIASDRRAEWWLIPKTVLALVVVAAAVVLRELYLQ